MVGRSLLFCVLRCVHAVQYSLLPMTSPCVCNTFPCRSCKNPPPRCSKSAAPHPPPNPEDILPIDPWPWSDDEAPKETYQHDDDYYSPHKGSGYYHKRTCSKRGAKYEWAPECAGKEGKTPLGGSCHGAALCQPGNAVTNAAAICTSSGWVVADGCFPNGCASAPSAILASFPSCISPGVLEQACTGTCQAPTTGAPVATCTPAGWNITGAPCGERSTDRKLRECAPHCTLHLHSTDVSLSHWDAPIASQCDSLPGVLRPTPQYHIFKSKEAPSPESDTASTFWCVTTSQALYRSSPIKV